MTKTQCEGQRRNTCDVSLISHLSFGKEKGPFFVLFCFGSIKYWFIYISNRKFLAHFNRSGRKIKYSKQQLASKKKHSNLIRFNATFQSTIIYRYISKQINLTSKICLRKSRHTKYTWNIGNSKVEIECIWFTFSRFP